MVFMNKLFIMMIYDLYLWVAYLFLDRNSNVGLDLTESLK